MNSNNPHSIPTRSPPTTPTSVLQRSVCGGGGAERGLLRPPQPAAHHTTTEAGSDHSSQWYLHRSGGGPLHYGCPNSHPHRQHQHASWWNYHPLSSCNSSSSCCLQPNDYQQQQQQQQYEISQIEAFSSTAYVQQFASTNRPMDLSCSDEEQKRGGGVRREVEVPHHHHTGTYTNNKTMTSYTPASTSSSGSGGRGGRGGGYHYLGDNSGDYYYNNSSSVPTTTTSSSSSSTTTMMMAPLSRPLAATITTPPASAFAVLSASTINARDGGSGSGCTRSTIRSGGGGGGGDRCFGRGGQEEVNVEGHRDHSSSQRGRYGADRMTISQPRHHHCRQLQSSSDSGEALLPQMCPVTPKSQVVLADASLRQTPSRDVTASAELRLGEKLASRELLLYSASFTPPPSAAAAGPPRPGLNTPTSYRQHQAALVSPPPPPPPSPSVEVHRSQNSHRSSSGSGGRVPPLPPPTADAPPKERSPLSDTTRYRGGGASTACLAKRTTTTTTRGKKIKKVDHLLTSGQAATTTSSGQESTVFAAPHLRRPLRGHLYPQGPPPQGEWANDLYCLDYNRRGKCKHEGSNSCPLRHCSTEERDVELGAMALDGFPVRFCLRFMRKQLQQQHQHQGGGVLEGNPPLSPPTSTAVASLSSPLLATGKTVPTCRGGCSYYHGTIDEERQMLDILATIPCFPPGAEQTNSPSEPYPPQQQPLVPASAICRSFLEKEGGCTFSTRTTPPISPPPQSTGSDVTCGADYCHYVHPKDRATWFTILLGAGGGSRGTKGSGGGGGEPCSGRSQAFSSSSSSISSSHATKVEENNGLASRRHSAPTSRVSSTTEAGGGRWRRTSSISSSFTVVETEEEGEGRKRKIPRGGDLKKITPLGAAATVVPWDEKRSEIDRVRLTPPPPQRRKVKVKQQKLHGGWQTVSILIPTTSPTPSSTVGVASKRKLTGRQL